MGKIFQLFMAMLLLQACTAPSPKCIESTCVHISQAREVDQKTQDMYRDLGLRVPIYVPDLSYPEDMRQSSTEATVIVALDIDKKGNVTNAEIQSATSPGFDEVTLEHASKMRFEIADAKTTGQLKRITFRLE